MRKHGCCLVKWTLFSKLVSLFQGTNYISNGGTNQGVVESEIKNLVHSFPVRVGIRPAGRRTGFVDGAMVIGR
jgi:hypothetical protein